MLCVKPNFIAPYCNRIGQEQINLIQFSVLKSGIISGILENPTIPIGISVLAIIIIAAYAFLSPISWYKGTVA